MARCPLAEAELLSPSYSWMDHEGVDCTCRDGADHQGNVAAVCRDAWAGPVVVWRVGLALLAAMVVLAWRRRRQCR